MGIKRLASRTPQEGVRHLTAWGGGDNYQEERWWGGGVPGTCQGGKGELERSLPGPVDLPLGGLRRKGSSNTVINILCTVIGFHLKLLQPRCYEPILVSQKARLFLHLESIILFTLFLNSTKEGFCFFSYFVHILEQHENADCMWILKQHQKFPTREDN